MSDINPIYRRVGVPIVCSFLFGPAIGVMIGAVVNAACGDDDDLNS